MKSLSRCYTVLVSCVVIALAACGGGGGGAPPSRLPPSSEQPTAMTWLTASLSDASVAYVPGGGYELDSSELAVDWLGFNAGSSLLDAQQARYVDGMWQADATSGMVSLPTGLAYTPFHVSKAGGWTVFRAVIGGTLYARFDGPNGQSSGFVPISTVARSIGWAAVDASGVARLYWPDSTGPNAVVTRTGHFNGTAWVDDGLEPGLSLYVDAFAAGPDGKGWLFYADSGPAARPGQYARYVDPINGLGTEVRLDDPDFGSSGSLRKAASEGGSAVTTVLRQSSASSGECLAVRRFKASVWSGTQCVNLLPTRASVGETYEVAAEVGGQVLVVWGDDAGRLYGNVRSASGAWIGARLLTVMPAGESLSSIHPSIDGSGAAIVVYRTSTTSGLARLHAVMYDAATETWGISERVDSNNASTHIRVAVTFNQRGEPGVLSFARSGGAYNEVHLSTRLKGSWSTMVAAADLPTQPNFPYDIATIQRLEPLGAGGWAAFWEVWSPVGSGARRLMVATYQ